MTTRALAPATDSFASKAMAACFTLSASDATRAAYWGDVRHWLRFCEGRGLDPTSANDVAVAAWVEELRAGSAPKTRARRVSALASVYAKLRRDKVVASNPFSVLDGPARERGAHARRPTPALDPEVARKMIAACERETGLTAIRDAALLRLLFRTGLRRSSVVAFTPAMLRPDPAGYLADVPAKGGKPNRVLVCGKALKALNDWLDARESVPATVPLFLRVTAFDEVIRPLTERDVHRIVEARGRAVGVEGVAPHQFRTRFLNNDKASLESRQHAAGHSDPKTTAGYNRQWLGREAFETMPEIEDA